MAVHDRCRTGDIAAAVQAELDQAGYGIVRDLSGPRVSHSIHEDPTFPTTAAPAPALAGRWHDYCH